MEEGVAKKELRGVKVKWTQRVEERPAHLLRANLGARKYDEHLFKRLQ